MRDVLSSWLGLWKKRPVVSETTYDFTQFLDGVHEAETVEAVTSFVEGFSRTRRSAIG